MNTFHPAHLEDLQKSGLTDESIEQSGIRTVFPPSEINKKIGSNIPGLTSCYEIPYDNNFSRFRAFYDSKSKGRNPEGRYLWLFLFKK